MDNTFIQGQAIYTTIIMEIFETAFFDLFTFISMQHKSVVSYYTWEIWYDVIINNVIYAKQLTLKV